MGEPQRIGESAPLNSYGNQSYSRKRRGVVTLPPPRCPRVNLYCSKKAQKTSMHMTFFETIQRPIVFHDYEMSMYT